MTSEFGRELKKSTYYVCSDHLAAIRKYILEPHCIFRLYIKNPRNNFNWFAYISPMERDLWVGIIALAIILPFFIALSARMPPKVKKATFTKQYLLILILLSTT